MEIPTYIQISHAIRLGHLDESLETMGELIVSRRRVIAAEIAAKLTPGTEFFLIAKMKPQLMAGAHCRYNGRNTGGKLRITLLETRNDKWRKGTSLVIPRTLVGEIIE